MASRRGEVLNEIADTAGRIVAGIRAMNDAAKQFQLAVEIPPEKPFLELIAKCGALKHPTKETKQ